MNGARHAGSVNDTIVPKLRRSDNLHKYVLLGSSAVVLLVGSINLLGEPEYHEDWPLRIASVTLVWTIVYGLCSYWVSKTMYLFASAYVTVLLLFHFGITIPLAFGLIRSFSYASGILAPWLERGGWYTITSLSCLGIGFSLTLKPRDRLTPTQSGEASAERTLSIAYWDGVGLLFASIIFFAMAIKSFGNLLEYSRVDFFRGAGDTRGLGAFLMVFPSAATLLVIGATKWRQKAFAYSVVLTATVVLILSGYRTFIFFPAMVGAILWVKAGRRIPFFVAATVVFLVLLVIPIIGSLRSVSSYESIGADALRRSYREASIMKSLTTMGQTAGVLAEVFRLVPEKESYRYGSTYLLALRNSIPNIGFVASKSQREEVLNRSLNDPKAIEGLIPSDWITYRIARSKFYRGEGVGFSGVGEPYMNFGMLGVIAYFVLLGMFLGWFDSQNVLIRPNLFVFAGAMYWPLVQTVRNDFGNFIKPCVFIFLILLMWRVSTRFFLKTYRRNSP